MSKKVLTVSFSWCISFAKLYTDRYRKSILVPEERLELSCLATYAPEAYVSTNFTIRALVPERGLGHNSFALQKVATPPHSSFDIVAAFKSSRKQRRLLASLFKNNLVPERGLEPPHPCEYSILSRARLPFRHSGNRYAFYLFHTFFQLLM